LAAVFHSVHQKRQNFAERLRSESHTVKRSLTDPRLFSGIGNSYSDEILHRAKMSPVKLTGRLTDAEIATLFDATRATLVEWTDRLRADAAGSFPEKVTAFRPEMAVHGKFGQRASVRSRCSESGTPTTDQLLRSVSERRQAADRSSDLGSQRDWPRVSAGAVIAPRHAAVRISARPSRITIVCS
jgi:formamidopyrimidine-DNA glycosylase